MAEALTKSRYALSHLNTTNHMLLRGQQRTKMQASPEQLTWTLQTCPAVCYKAYKYARRTCSECTRYAVKSGSHLSVESSQRQSLWFDALHSSSTYRPSQFPILASRQLFRHAGHDVNTNEESLPFEARPKQLANQSCNKNRRAPFLYLALSSQPHICSA